MKIEQNDELLKADICAVTSTCTNIYFGLSIQWLPKFSVIHEYLSKRVKEHSFFSSETITALFKTRFRLDFPFDLQELPAFAILG